MGFQIFAFITSEKYFSIDPIMMRNVSFDGSFINLQEDIINKIYI